MLGKPAITPEERRFKGDTLVLASHNAGKVAEFQTLFTPYKITIKSAAALDLPEPDEDGLTFAENALIKSRSAAEISGLPALADDSGLCVHALNGDPGIYSARWAQPGKDFNRVMEKVWQALQQSGSADTRAEFVCALALSYPGTHLSELHVGVLRGHIVWPPRGNAGFGYDPIFVPEGYTETLAELGAAVKDTISHRARAFEKLAAMCFAHRRVVVS
jgi:XTP/dITP diphosphohydrolase